jgi:hypothetical protein
MAEARIGIVAEFLGKKAFGQAETATTKLSKGVKRLGATLLAAFSVQKLAQFSKNAVKAFAENEKSAKRLETVVKNLGLAFEIPGIEDNLDKISAKFGYEGEVLREAFQKLITTTGSAKKSQDLLNLSLDIAAGSGVDLLTVNQDLAAAYVGQTRGLRKYNLGLTQSELKTLDFDKAVDKLSNNFKGAGLAELQTYSGQMRVLGEAADNAQEIIGKSLVDSLMLLSGGGNSVQPLADSMQELSIWLGDAIYGFALLVEQIKDMPGGGVLEGVGGRGFLKTFSPLVIMLDKLSKKGKEAKASVYGGYPSSALGGTFVDPTANLRKKAEADAARRAKEIANLQKKTLDTQKKTNALTKAAKTIDLDRIGMTAALRGKVSETDRLSLNLQLALLDKNEAAALKLSAQLDAAIKRQNELAAALEKTPKAPNPYSEWKIPVLGIFPNDVNPNDRSDFVDAMTVGKPMFPTQPSSTSGDTVVNVEVIVDGEAVGNAVRNSSINSSLSGSFNSVNRSNRFAIE